MKNNKNRQSANSSKKSNYQEKTYHGFKHSHNIFNALNVKKHAMFLTWRAFSEKTFILK